MENSVTVTRRLVLRPFREEDRVETRLLLCSEEIAATYMLPEFSSPEEADGLFDRLLSFSVTGKHLEVAITLRDRVIGFINDCGTEGGSIELGYAISPAEQGKGYMTEALTTMIKKLFQQGWEQVVTGYFAGNEASRRVMEKSGMHPISREEELVYRGKSRHCLYYAMENPAKAKNLSEEEKIKAGMLFAPGDPSLRAIKLKAHNLNVDYNRTYEDEEEKRFSILKELLGEFGEGGFIQGPIAFHYGSHTHIGKRFFGNFNLTVQDDAEVTIGDDCNFGPNVTIVTPQHPLLPGERKALLTPDGVPRHLCWARPVFIGNDCWLGANVTVCPGVTIGDGCVVGAGSVVTRDLPAGSLAVGAPARVLRTLTEADSLKNFPQLLGENRVIQDEA